MFENLDLSLVWVQVGNFWYLLAGILGIAIGAVLLRFARRIIRQSISWMRERLDYRSEHF